MLGSTGALFAEFGSTEPRYFPYEGRLELGGLPTNGGYDMRFSLFAADATVATANDCMVTDNCTELWGVDIASVTVVNGQFAVALGPVSDAILAGSDRMFLAIAVKPEGAGPYTALSGRQEILSAPFAARSAAGKDFKVTTLNATGAVTAATLTATTSVTAPTVTTSTALRARGAASPLADNGIATIENPSLEGLSIGYDTTNAWSWLYSRSVNVQGRPLNVNGSLFVNFGGGVGLGVRATNAKLQFANELGNKVLFWDGNAADRYGLGMNNSAMTAFFPPGAAFEFRQNAYNGAQVARIDGNGNMGLNGALYAGGEIGGGSIRNRDCQWTESGEGTGVDTGYHDAFCPAGRYMYGMRILANDYLDGSLALYCCLP